MGIYLFGQLKGAVCHDLHHIRCGMLEPFFSKCSVAELVPSIQNKVSRLCDQLDGAGKTGEVINLDECYSAFTTDIMSEYYVSTNPQATTKPSFGPKRCDYIDSWLESKPPQPEVC